MLLENRQRSLEPLHRWCSSPGSVLKKGAEVQAACPQAAGTDPHLGQAVPAASGHGLVPPAQGDPLATLAPVLAFIDLPQEETGWL